MRGGLRASATSTHRRLPQPETKARPRIGRKIQQRDIVGNSKVAAAVVGGAVEDQQDVLPRKLAREDLKEDLEAFGIRGWHDQIDASAILGRDRTVQIDVFADELGGDTRSCANRRPAWPQSIHSAETRLISEHDAQPPPAPRSNPPGSPHSIRKAVFLKAFCAARSRLGWNGRGISLRQPCRCSRL